MRCSWCEKKRDFNQAQSGMCPILQRILLALAVVILTMTTVEAKPIHMIAKDMPLQTLVQTIARADRLSVVGLESLEGSISLEVKEESGKTAIHKLGERLGFLVYEEGQTLLLEGGPKEKEQRHLRRIVADVSTPEELGTVVETIVPKDHVHILPTTNEVLYYGTVKEIIEVEKALQSWHGKRICERIRHPMVLSGITYGR